MATIASTRSPSSPRLPSPPPIAELQIAPKSPAITDVSGTGQTDIRSQHTIDVDPTRRIRPGTKSANMTSGPPLIPLNELDSAFQLQEHLKSLHYKYTHKDTQPIALTKESSQLLSNPPPGIDRSLWLYELCRLLTNNLNTVIVAFFNDSPPCSAVTCPEMRASEWQYLCAVHDPPKSCCAIDYCCHTLDSAANMLTSTKHFPSRLSLGVATDNSGGSGSGAQQGLRHLTNIFRRLYRIFAHAWFQHRRMFWQVESEKGLYIFFKTVCDSYHLIPEDSYTIPPEAEGGEMEAAEADTPQDSHKFLPTEQLLVAEPVEPNLDRAAAATRRRHKSTPSTGAFVNIVPEEDESEEASSAKLPRSSTVKSVLHESAEAAAAPEPSLPALPSLSEGEKSKPEEHVKNEKEAEAPEVASQDNSEPSMVARSDEKAELKDPDKGLEKEEDPDKEAVVEGSKVKVEEVDEKSEASKADEKTSEAEEVPAGIA